MMPFFFSPPSRRPSPASTRTVIGKRRKAAHIIPLYIHLEEEQHQHWSDEMSGARAGAPQSLFEGPIRPRGKSSTRPHPRSKSVVCNRRARASRCRDRSPLSATPHLRAPRSSSSSECNIENDQTNNNPAYIQQLFRQVERMTVAPLTGSLEKRKTALSSLCL